MKLLDCTLRDGGYYTNWDFNEDLVKEYANAMETLPIEYVEVGYRSIPLNGYFGKYFYCPVFVLKELKEMMPSKKLAIILNEKDIRVSHIHSLLVPCLPYVTLVRLAIDPQNFERAIELARSIKKLGFEVAFNVMYMSNWKNDSSFLDKLDGIGTDVIDYFYMVDSFGGILPNEFEEIFQLVKAKTDLPLGFHGHNNLEMALINSKTAMDLGCEIIDSTITGMGRGAGNLKTELLLTYLSSIGKIDIEFNKLSNLVAMFENMRENYGWGTSLPYMFSGAHSLPQKQVMEWVGLNRYSLNSIVNALNNQKMVVADNVKLPELTKKSTFNKAILVGGGHSANAHSQAVLKYLSKLDNSCLIHAGIKNIDTYINANCDQYYCIVGTEDVNTVVNEIKDDFVNQCFVLPPYPRKMGTSLSPAIQKCSMELKELAFTGFSTESPLAIAIQCAIDLNVDELLLVGFDGYDSSLKQNQLVLAKENQKILDKARVLDLQLKFLTPSRYQDITLDSIYSYV